jgi:hypothetical protein
MRGDTLGLLLLAKQLVITEEQVLILIILPTSPFEV